MARLRRLEANFGLTLEQLVGSIIVLAAIIISSYVFITIGGVDPDNPPMDDEFPRIEIYRLIVNPDQFKLELSFTNTGTKGSVLYDSTRVEVVSGPDILATATLPSLYQNKDESTMQTAIAKVVGTAPPDLFESILRRGFPFDVKVFTEFTFRLGEFGAESHHKEFLFKYSR